MYIHFNSRIGYTCLIIHVYIYIYSNKNEFSLDSIGDASLIIFGGSQENFNEKELNELKIWLDSGGRALFLLNSSTQKHSNLNEFLSR